MKKPFLRLTLLLGTCLFSTLLISQSIVTGDLAGTVTDSVERGSGECSHHHDQC